MMNNTNPPVNPNTIERRALYHLLRVNWLHEPTLPVEPWQVEDYRALPLQTLMDRLIGYHISLDRLSFITYADECDSPEELTDHLIAGQTLKADQEDQIYLLIFELWRRLMSEKPSLSVLCNELDYQIYLYDCDQFENPLALQDALLHFAHVLDENVDGGISPKEAFRLISTYCANNLETFLYDFISEQIDEGNESYAQELLDDFDIYLADNKWFKLLRMRLFGQSPGKTAQKLADQIVEDYLPEKDLEFNLEFLSFSTEIGNLPLFRLILQHTLPLIQSEEDFQDLLSITIDYFRRLDEEQQEKHLQTLLEKRMQRTLNSPLQAQDPDFAILMQLFNL